MARRVKIFVLQFAVILADVAVRYAGLLGQAGGGAGRHRGRDGQSGVVAPILFEGRIACSAEIPELERGTGRICRRLNLTDT